MNKGYEDGIMLCIKIKCIRLILNEAKKMSDRAWLNLGQKIDKTNKITHSAFYESFKEIENSLDKIELDICSKMEKCNES